MLIRSRHPLAMQVDAEAGAIIQGELERHGLTVQVGVEVTTIESDRLGRVARAQLSTGQALDCQMVVVGRVSGHPSNFSDRIACALMPASSSMTICRPAAEGVYAAGDVGRAF